MLLICNLSRHLLFPPRYHLRLAACQQTSKHLYGTRTTKNGHPTHHYHHQTNTTLSTSTKPSRRVETAVCQSKSPPHVNTRAMNGDSRCRRPWFVFFLLFYSTDFYSQLDCRRTINNNHHRVTQRQRMGPEMHWCAFLFLYCTNTSRYTHMCGDVPQPL